MTACESDFYLSESETKAYLNTFLNESSANALLTQLNGQLLTVQFDGSANPPRITGTNLVPLLRSTNLGLVESWNRQINLDRLNTELQTQMERWIQKKLQLYAGNNNARVKLSRLNTMHIRFLNSPQFTYRADRQSIVFDLTIALTIDGSVEVNAVDPVLNFFIGVNGTHPIHVDINNFRLTGETTFINSFADKSKINFKLTPQPNIISVSGNAPARVRDGVAGFLSMELSQSLNATFTQSYDYFALMSLMLTPSAQQPHGTLSAKYLTRPATASPMLHYVARAADGKLYHLKKTEGGQGAIVSNPFPSLTTRIENDPTIFASDTDKLELAATTVNGDLAYAQWVDEQWIEQKIFAPASSASTAGYKGKPAIVASTPGQVEIIAEGRNGGLWHIRRLNGQWMTPVQITIPSVANYQMAPFVNPSAVISGTKFAVVFKDGLNHLLAIVYDMETKVWGQAALIPTAENINFAPAVVASGDGKLDVVYIGQSGTPYHRVLLVQTAQFIPNAAQIGIGTVNNEINIGGQVIASPTLVCSRKGQFELMALGSDNRLWHNHYVGPNSPGGFVDGRNITQGWTGWGNLNGNFSGTVTNSDERMTDYAAVATRTGKVELIARVRPSVLDNNVEQLLVYNSYDSERFGRQLWKSVHWRGYEQVTARRFLGTPAVAATDRQFTTSYVNSNYATQKARFTENNFAGFDNITTTSIVGNGVPVDPTVISSMPGYLDIFTVASDGKIRHTRQQESGSVSTQTLAAPANVTFNGRPSVISQGNGWLGVAATGNNGSIYFWSLQNGAWSTYTTLSGNVISIPILVNLGSGQMLVLGLGTDKKLYYWYYRGSWAAHQPVSIPNFVDPLKFSSLSASSWGQGTVDLVYVDDQTKALFHGRISARNYIGGLLSTGFAPNRSFTSLGGSLIETPVITALSPSRLHVFAIGTDREVYSNWSSFDISSVPWNVQQAPPIVWSGYNYIGGGNGLLLGGVAKTGANELTAVGIDPTGRLQLTRSIGNKWSGFSSVVVPSNQTQTGLRFFRPAVSTYH